MLTKEVKTINIAKEFAEATKQKEFIKIEELIHSNGKFEIQTSRNNTIEVDKDRFLKWYKARLKKTVISEVIFDQCLHCHIGSTVVIFNNGQFPRTIKDNSERSKTGLLIETEEGKISYLKYCFVFLKTENKYAYECKKGFEILVKKMEILKQGNLFDEI
jgi:hypothetical protein